MKGSVTLSEAVRKELILAGAALNTKKYAMRAMIATGANLSGEEGADFVREVAAAQARYDKAYARAVDEAVNGGYDPAKGEVKVYGSRGVAIWTEEGDGDNAGDESGEEAADLQKGE